MVSLKPATENDFEAIEKLAHLVWHKHYIPIIGKAQVDYMLKKMYSTGALKEQMHSGQSFYLINNQNNAVGFISMSKDDKKNFFLHKFYILQEEQNTGLGSEAFRQVFEKLNQPETVRLTVNRQNFKAVNFYFKLGFKIEKVEDFDIGEGYFMNDFVMLWKKN